MTQRHKLYHNMDPTHLRVVRNDLCRTTPPCSHKYSRSPLTLTREVIPFPHTQKSIPSASCHRSKDQGRSANATRRTSTKSPASLCCQRHLFAFGSHWVRGEHARCALERLGCAPRCVVFRVCVSGSAHSVVVVGFSALMTVRRKVVIGGSPSPPRYQLFPPTSALSP